APWGNCGKTNARLGGIRAARHDVVITIDDDLQNPPEEIPTLLETLAAGYDVVYGTPERERHGFWRDTASRSTKLVLHRVFGASTATRGSAFRAFRTDLRAAFQQLCGPSRTVS